MDTTLSYSITMMSSRFLRMTQIIVEDLKIRNVHYRFDHIDITLLLDDECDTFTFLLGGESAIQS